MAFSNRFFFVFLVLAFSACRNRETAPDAAKSAVPNQIRYATGLAIYKYDGFSVLKISNPWPNAAKGYTYVLHQKNAAIPDSLKAFPSLTIPVKRIVVTSTTHIPSLEMLGVENTLVGFPNTSYISSEKVRARINAGQVKELGSNQNLNTELALDLAPEVIVGFGIDNNNPTLDNLQKSGLKVILNGDWNEQTPLGKAEWIKFFGALYDLDQKAEMIFSSIEKDYKTTLALAKKARQKPTVLGGAMYENHWYMPKGDSWGSTFIKDANGQYLWAGAAGTGSLSLSFETVFEKAQHADFWISEFGSFQEMLQNNPHYAQFDAFKKHKVYSFSNKKGKTGGVVYYELAPNRPDLVLKDLVKILHPELLPEHQLFFFERLK